MSRIPPFMVRPRVELYVEVFLIEASKFMDLKLEEWPLFPIPVARHALDEECDIIYKWYSRPCETFPYVVEVAYHEDDGISLRIAPCVKPKRGIDHNHLLSVYVYRRIFGDGKIKRLHIGRPIVEYARTAVLMYIHPLWEAWTHDSHEISEARRRKRRK